jgi:D-sedoheptulose 7-phosphate isomerase
MSERDVVRVALGEAADLHRRVAAGGADAIVRAAEVLREAMGKGRRVWVFGNGGSATDAQHFAAELVGRFGRERAGLPVVALTTDTAVLTAVANDYGFAQVFARQVEAHGARGDVAVAITTSGASENVNVALERARAMGLVTIGLTGRDGGRTAHLVDVHVNVPGVTSARVQEVHRTVLHVLCELVEREKP